MLSTLCNKLYTKTGILQLMDAKYYENVTNIVPGRVWYTILPGEY